MSCSDLLALKDEALSKISDENFCANFFDDSIRGEVFYSKGPHWTIIPLELEMAGIKPSAVIAKEPVNKKNVSKYYFYDDQLVRIESYNSQGLLEEFEVLRLIDGRLFSLRKNKHNEILWLKIAELNSGKVVRACRVDGDMEYWAYRYSWEGERVEEVVSLASNGVAGTVIKVEYDVGLTVARLYFMNGINEVIIYSHA
ncbi:hypothetical protein M1M11_31640 [Pseudomonas azerbaijanoccidens]|jgi:hypothetical protein|uniref:hypothetical protein n=1 Tax=Pseudomonas azerbaijanoccidentalis TaxID=2842347 RepID=UPI00200B3C92|nr:hypothetical protein [Pseudomonas azerbaijanoccidentalis]MCK8669440.1 hypothetical protein [Pseudomonas azerbaijanoccidentalis]